MSTHRRSDHRRHPDHDHRTGALASCLNGLSYGAVIVMLL